MMGTVPIHEKYFSFEDNKPLAMVIPSCVSVGNKSTYASNNEFGSSVSVHMS